MDIHTIHAPRNTHGRGEKNHYLHYFCMVMAGLIMVLAMSAGAAWSFEVQDTAPAQNPAANDAGKKISAAPAKPLFQRRVHA